MYAGPLLYIPEGGLHHFAHILRKTPLYAEIPISETLAPWTRWSRTRPTKEVCGASKPARGHHRRRRTAGLLSSKAGGGSRNHVDRNPAIVLIEDIHLGRLPTVEPELPRITDVVHTPSRQALRLLLSATQDEDVGVIVDADVL